jgi:hypothetical protein
VPTWLRLTAACASCSSVLRDYGRHNRLIPPSVHPALGRATVTQSQQCIMVATAWLECLRTISRDIYIVY